MEQFDQQQKNLNVKEKSMYLLHLDGARILILSAITIGLLTIAFLVGMKITGETSKDTLASQDVLSDQIQPAANSVPSDASKNEIPDLSAQTDVNTMPSTPSAAPAPSLPDLSIAKNNVPQKMKDVTVAEEEHIAIPPAREVAKTEKISAKKAHKKADKRETFKKKTNVVEVSSEISAKTEKHSKAMYLLQVASFDKLDVAKKEVSSLKLQKYDAFMDKTSIKGKTFFRVRIGPVAVKDKAVQMMNELQNNDRYAECFIVKE